MLGTQNADLKFQNENLISQANDLRSRLDTQNANNSRLEEEIASKKKLERDFESLKISKFELIRNLSKEVDNLKFLIKALCINESLN